jgi:hypothetical protein
MVKRLKINAIIKKLINKMKKKFVDLKNCLLFATLFFENNY